MINDFINQYFQYLKIKKNKIFYESLSLIEFKWKKEYFSVKKRYKNNI